jgi:fructosamine-3-kinase
VIEPQTGLALSRAQAETVLAAWLGGTVACTGVRPLHGGLVNTVLELTFDRPPHRAVVKLHSGGGDGFGREAASLAHLRETTACPCPRVFLQDSSCRLIPHAFLLLEALPGVGLEGLDLPRSDRDALDVELAEILLELHGRTRAHFGPVDAPPGQVAWAELIASRLREARLDPNVATRLSPAVLGQVDAAIGATEATLGDAGVPTLIHGDVWEGDTIVRRGDDGWHVAGLVDPAAEYADVEAELAYVEVFDKPRPAFFAAYTAHRPLRPGYERRRRFYWLHTGLVHVALFGDPFFCEFTARTAADIISAAPAGGVAGVPGVLGTQSTR